MLSVENVPPNDEDLRAIRDGMARVIQQSPTGAVYRSQYAAELYIACGGCDDWLYTNATKERYAFTFESRSATALGGGFVLPASQIRPTGIESTAAGIWFGERMLEAWHEEKQRHKKPA